MNFEGIVPFCTVYRNPFLTQAMNELNMIDTMGYGIYQKLICAE